MSRALDELDVKGLSTTKPLHKLLALDPQVKASDVHTRWLEPWLEQNAHRLTL
jgi:acetyl-CoA carboxylase biotin carboxylase subunit